MQAPLNLQAPIQTLADVGGTFWLPPQASSYAGDIDWLLWFITAICVVFFLLVAALVIIFGWKYRYREGVPVGNAPKHNTALELTWTFVPTVIVIIIFVYGFKGFLRMNVAPSNPYEMVINASMWQFGFQYPNGHTDDQLHLPTGVPVEFILSSSDVIHGFFIPSFRVKKDIVPGRYNKIWAMPVQTGEYDIFCTQYCGDKHSRMRAKVTIQTPEAFKDWMDKSLIADSNLPPIEHGKALYAKKGCVNCHTLDGGASTGPTWKNAYGYPVNFTDGTSLTADDNYLRSMIVNPNNRIIQGFQAVMPSFQGQLKDKTHDVDDLITFIKSNSDKYKPDPTATPTTGPATGTPQGAAVMVPGPKP